MKTYVRMSFVFAFILVFAAFSASFATVWTDDCGYVATDSDESGGPDVEWVDISDVGVQVTGQLSDDNFIGPFNIGFDFPFYWYTVNQFWIGSNGYIAFQPGLLAQPLPAIPNTTPPNDILAVYGADIFFAPGDPDQQSQCYYYNDEANGRLVVSFDDVQCWLAPENGGIQGHHFFQIILYDDGTIRYNYGEDDGPFSNNSITIGIENVTGGGGIQNYFGEPIPHSDYAIEFAPPEEIECEVHDIAVKWILNEDSRGEFFFVNETSILEANIFNTGTEPETDIEVTATTWLHDAEGGWLDPTGWEESQTIASLASGESQTLEFLDWTPNGENVYALLVEANLDGDQVEGNNDQFVDIPAVDYSGGTMLNFVWEYPYDSWSWAGGGLEESGLAVEFPVPMPTKVNSALFNLALPQQNAWPTFIGRIYDDSGENGSPGEILYEETMDLPEEPGWFEMDVSGENIIISSGSFYVAWIQVEIPEGQQHCALGRDNTGSPARRSYEYTGSFAPFRNGETEDLMIRTMVEVGEFGTIMGNITDSDTGDPIPARVWAEGDGGQSTTYADENGDYTLTVAPGDWTIYASFFGYDEHESQVITVENEDEITYDIAMAPQPRGTLQGHVTDLLEGAPVEGAHVELVGVPIEPVMTDGAGFYTFGDVPAYFPYNVECSAPNYQTVTVSYEVEPDQVNTLDFQLQFVQSFEEDDGGFTGTGEWEWGTPAGNSPDAYDGDMCWATDLDGDYNGPANIYLNTTEFTLDGDAPYELHFYHWYNTNDGWDGGNVQISTNGGDDWDIIDPIGDYPDDTVVGLGGGRGYTGDSDGWEEAVFDLTDYAGQTVWFRYRFGVTNSRGYLGWYVDYFAVLGQGGGGGGDDATVSGSVFYWDDDLAMQGVDVVMAAYSDITDGNGQFSITAPTGDNYTMAAEFYGDHNGSISAFDAARVAQYSAGLYDFNEYQIIAADVTGNGDVGPFDAARIAQFSAGLPHGSLCNTWTFDPAEYSYSPLMGDMMDQDYIGILYGEATGNWAPVAATAVVNKATGASTSRTVGTTVANVKSLPGTTVLVPVVVEDLSGDDVIAYETTINYDTEVVSFVGVVTEGTMSENMEIVTGETEQGLRVVAYGIESLEGAGTLFMLELEVVGELNSYTDITLEDLMFNEGVVMPNVTAGSVKASPEVAVPTIHTLGQNYPNPFNPVTTIDFGLPVGADVNISIYDVTGKLVKTLESGYLEAGYHTVQWNGKDNMGNAVNSGVYFYRLESDNFNDTKQMILMK